MESPAVLGSRGQVILQVSTTFFPDAKLPGASKLPDVLLYSKDSVFFYCHQAVLNSRSVNHFGQIIPSGEDWNDPDELPPGTTDGPGRVLALSVGETASVVTLILLIVYGMPCASYAPDLDTIGEALRWLDKYGIQIPDEHASVGIWPLVLQHAQTQPIHAYALAAKHNIEDICVQISPLTLGTSLHNISESDALTMGPIYLRRIFFLHVERQAACKRVFEGTPKGHAETASCTLADQADVARAWDLQMAEVALHPNQPDFPVEELRSMFAATADGRACGACREAIRSRVEEACAEWAAVKPNLAVVAKIVDL